MTGRLVLGRCKSTPGCSYEVLLRGRGHDDGPSGARRGERAGRPMWEEEDGVGHGVSRRCLPGHCPAWEVRLGPSTMMVTGLVIRLWAR